MKNIFRRACLLSLSLALVGATSVAGAALPELPRKFLNTDRDLSYDRPADIIVKKGADLQAALQRARPGQIIELEAGAKFTGNFRLPNKAGREWIYIRSSRHQELPAEGQRVGPQHSALMPKIVSPNSDPAIMTMFSAHNYRFVGLEISTAAANFNLVLLGSGLAKIDDPIWTRKRATKKSELPSDITFDRCYLHSTSNTKKARTGILADGKSIAVIDSYISNFKDTSDSQAIVVWQGVGPFKFVNNFLEGAGENVMFGGEEILIPNAVPSDIEVRGNHFRKRLDWITPDIWTIKNLFELKAAQRVLISGNIFENNWQDAQSGVAILFTVRNQYGNNPWAIVQDVTFTDNIVRSTGQGITVKGEDDLRPSQQTKRILISNNILEDVSKRFFPNTRFMKINTPGRPVLDLTISHNLFLHADSEIGYGAILLENQGVQVENLVFEDNILTHGDFGLNISSRRARNFIFRNNTIIMTPGERSYSFYMTGSNFESDYTADNFLADGIAAVRFKKPKRGNYRLKKTSPYRKAASDGKDIGPNIKALNNAVYGSLPKTLGAPTFLTARPVSSTAIELSWQDNSNETVFRISRKVGNSGWEAWQEVRANTTRARFDGLAPGQTYSFAVHAKKGSASSPTSNVVKVTMPKSNSGAKLGAPKKLKAWAVSPTTVRLRWKDKSKDETGFGVWIREGNREWKLLAVNPANSRRLKFTGASPGTTYFFSVRARKRDARSEWSNTASVTTPRN
ncbi:MAG: fibronectin type III domain-containing protein [Rhodothermales bacterium]|nr:fibronectin type III domain-containing protein [Rhodothermales bacterium]